MASAAPDTAAIDFPELQEASPVLIAAIREGLPVARFATLQEGLDVSSAALLELLRLSPSTLGRRRRAGTFSAEESERLVRLGRLLVRAVEVFEGLEEARRWLKQPVRALGGAIPLEYAALELGAREVERVLGRLEHGVYS